MYYIQLDIIYWHTNILALALAVIRVEFIYCLLPTIDVYLNNNSVVFIQWVHKIRVIQNSGLI